MKPAPADVAPHASRLTRLYVLALSAVACLSILGQLLVQYSLDRQLSDSTIVNLAGRQRMLSQQLSKAALALERGSSPEQNSIRRSEIAEVLAQWRRADEGLRRGSTALGLPGRNTPSIEHKLAEIEPHFLAMGEAAEALVSNRSDSQAAVNLLLAHEPRFLAAMDAIVGQYEQEARERVAWLKGVERGLLALTLLVLACEGWFIFRPAVRRIRAAAAVMKESRQQLEIAKQLADSANEAKSRFLGTISHELRNPLQAILGSVELAARTSDDTQRREHLETITAAARSLLVMLNDLLDLARIEAGKLEIVSTPLDPIKLTQRTLGMVRPQAQSQGLSLEQSFPTDLPAGLCGDELRVQQVLLNLLGNAIKFTPTGLIALRLSLVSDAPGQARLRWEVSDTGVGIATSQQATIFDAFIQVAVTAERRSGAGLGLAICKRLVGLMEGDLGVASELGRGSTFWFELPMGKDGSAQLASPETVLSQTQQPSLRVLIVDDDPVNRRLLAQLVEVLQHRAVVAADGGEALARYRAEPFDAVLLDWQMPDMNGGELATALRALEQELGRTPATLIVLSAGVPSAQSRNWNQSGCDRWLIKPVGLTELNAALAGVPSSREPDGDQADRWARVLSRLGGRRELLAQLADSYCAGFGSVLTELQSAADQGRHAEVARLAHLLAGQVSNFDAGKVVSVAEALEEAALGNRLDKAHLARLRSDCQRLARELEPWLLTAERAT